ncbi:MAG: hypothetical protein HOP30_13315 [Cyclobacteriaceae bacterium]|nr:hypothetical protein [Cyclobacteriaceae bacterium]
MKTCPTGKKMYPTEAIAEDALLEAHVRFDYGKSGGPIAVYQCEDCGCYHFTSKGTMNPKLATFLKSSTKKVEDEAARWQNKWKK